MPFFSSVVLRTILRVVPVDKDEESLPLLPLEESPDEDEDDEDLGATGSGIR